MELQRRGERGAQNKKAEGTQDSTGRLPLSSTQWVPFFLFKTLCILFLERDREGERETSMCGCLSHAPYWGPGQQPRHVP